MPRVLSDQVTQGSNIQRTNLNKPWGHCIDGQSHYPKEPNCSHHQSRPGAMFSGLLHQLSGWGSRRELFEMSVRPWEPHPGIASWATTGFWGAQPPFFTLPSFAFKLTFKVGSLAEILQTISHEVVRTYHIWNNFNDFSSDTAWLALAKQMIYPTDWSAPLTPLKVSASSSAKDSASFFPFWLYTQVFFSFSAFHYSGMEQWRYGCPSAS